MDGVPVLTAGIWCYISKSVSWNQGERPVFERWRSRIGDEERIAASFLSEERLPRRCPKFRHRRLPRIAPLGSEPSGSGFGTLGSRVRNPRVEVRDPRCSSRRAQKCLSRLAERVRRPPVSPRWAARRVPWSRRKPAVDRFVTVGPHLTGFGRLRKGRRTLGRASCVQKSDIPRLAANL